MATDSDSFKMWRGYYDALKLLPTAEQRDQFFMGLCGYVFDGIEPKFTDPAAEFGFTMVRESAKRSMEIAAKARENGASGGRPAKKNHSKNRPKNQSVSGSVNQGQNQSKNQGQKRSVACGSYASANALASPTGAYAAPADAAPPAPEPSPIPYDWSADTPCDQDGHQPPPPPSP